VPRAAHHADHDLERRVAVGPRGGDDGVELAQQAVAVERAVELDAHGLVAIDRSGASVVTRRGDSEGGTILPDAPRACVCVSSWYTLRIEIEPANETATSRSATGKWRAAAVAATKPAVSLCSMPNGR